MNTVFRILTLMALAVDVASAVLLYWDAEAAIQDAAGRGMAYGFLGLTAAAMAAAILLLLASYWSHARWPAVAAFVIALVPLVPVVLPQLL
jgi:hypothetical protein